MNVPPAARKAFLALPDAVQWRARRSLGRYAPWEDGQAPPAPTPPDGMTIGPPDFIGVGVPKAGTSWWFSLIAAHPDVCPPPRKELNYFNRIFFQRVRAQGLNDDDLVAYHRWFPRPPGSRTGEWTPSYLFAYQLPPILRRTAPEAKVVILLRDPVERYQSDISRSMPRRRLRMVRYRGLARGFYAAELEPWEQAYDPSEMLVLQYEACTRQPSDQLAATYRFLGLDDAFRPPGLTRPVNETKAKRTVAAGFRRLLVELYEPDVAALSARYPQIDLSLWPNFSHLTAATPGD